MELKELLIKAFELGGSDIFIVPGAKVTCKVKGDMVTLTEDIVKPAAAEELVRGAYDLAGRDSARCGRRATTTSRSRWSATAASAATPITSAAPSPPLAAWWPSACPTPNSWASRTW